MYADFLERLRFAELKEVLLEYDSMTEKEQNFTNVVRGLYYHAAVSSGKTDESGSHVFYGGHVVIEDSGVLYKKWEKQLKDKEVAGGSRSSSHYSDVTCQQYEVRFPKLGCILFGLTKDNNTWFQNEAHAMTGSYTDQVIHVVGDYGSHVISGFKQIGALGTSDYSEKKNSELFMPRKAFKILIGKY